MKKDNIFKGYESKDDELMTLIFEFKINCNRPPTFSELWHLTNYKMSYLRKRLWRLKNMNKIQYLDEKWNSRIDV